VENREIDPTSLRLEFDGMKKGMVDEIVAGRAYDNGVYAIFSIRLAWMMTKTKPDAP
jgi:hypothetical protein